MLGGTVPFTPNSTRGSGSAELTIADNPMTITVTKLSDAYESGSAGVFRITRSGGDLSNSFQVGFTMSGTATEGTDYTTASTATFGANCTVVDVTISRIADNLVEGNETITLTIASSSTQYDISGSPCDMTLYDDPPTITVEVLEYAWEGHNDGTFRLTRTGGDHTATLTVNFTVGGTATSVTDYAYVNNSVMFAANESTADVAVEVVEDYANDPGETVTLTITSGTNYVIGEGDEAVMFIWESVAATFTLTDSQQGTIVYDIPWQDVDPEEATQSLPLSNFSLALAGVVLTEANADFTTSPTVEFEYGEIVGITFAIDTSAITGYAYSDISSTEFTVTAVNSGNMEEETGELAPKDWVWIDFSNFRDTTWGTGTQARADTLFLTISTDTTSYLIEVPIPAGNSRDDSATMIRQALSDHGFVSDGVGFYVIFRTPAQDGVPITDFSITHNNTAQNSDPTIRMGGPP